VKVKEEDYGHLVTRLIKVIGVRGVKFKVT
jgi:hypothetical protein